MELSDYIGASVSTLIIPIVIVVGGSVAARRVRREGGGEAQVVDSWIRWWLVGGMVAGALVIAVSFWFATGYMADQMGYRHSPYQFEVSLANLAFAVMGWLCVRRRAALPVVATGFAVFMWGALLGHVYQYLVNGNDTPGNVIGIWIYDLVVPLALLLLVRREQRLADRSPTG